MKILMCGILLSVLTSIVGTQIKQPLPPDIRKPLPGDSLQILVVETYNWNDFQGKARLIERTAKGAEWKTIRDEIPVVLGRNGLGIDPMPYFPAVRKQLADPPVKHEGDGRSPAGVFPLTFAFGSGTVPKTLLPFTELQEFTECVDDIKSTHYNTVVNRMQVGNFDWLSSEKMLSVGPAYERGVFVAYNSYPPIRGDGSCIFLHIWKDANTGTAGCTAMSRSDLEWLLTRLDPAKTPYLFQMPAISNRLDEIPWKLPKLK